MTAQMRYSYGGHLTFPVRYGWLPKGIARLVESGGFAATTEVADQLGLGSKMVEALGFWLKATGLSGDDEVGKTKIPTDLALLIAERDRFCELPGTWWFLHLMLARTPGTVWSWFFNVYAERIFDRASCEDAFLEHTRSQALRPATAAVAHKDVACLLASYAGRPGVDFVDPDDLGASPLRELGLIWRHEQSLRFERSRKPGSIPIEAILASASALAEETGRDAFSFRELATLPFGPGRIFCAGLDALETAVTRAAVESPHAKVDTLAGERMLLVKRRKPPEWLKDLYDRMGATS